MASLGESALDKYGQVRVRDTLELLDFPGTLFWSYFAYSVSSDISGIFCIGDAVSNSERNRLGKYPRHARAVIPNLLARLEGSTPQNTYSGSIETLRVSIGSVSRSYGCEYPKKANTDHAQKRGVMTFGAPWFWPWGIVFGSWLAVKAQSRELILPKGHRIMGLARGWSKVRKEV